jgi:hypothetical protein
MNKTISLIIAFLFLFITAQTQAQEMREKQSKVKYSGIIETGVIFSTRHANIQQTFVNGVKINNMHTVGFGVGFGGLFYKDAELSMPIYANYRVNFLSEKRSPFINVAAGVALTEESLNLYSGLTAGIRFYKFSLSSGVNVQTVGKDAKPLVGFIIQVGIHF